MRAMLWTNYGPPDVLHMGEVEKPAPKADELLVRIHASTVTAGDCELRAFKTLGLLWLPLRLYMGWLRPSRVRILGQELAGEVEAVGEGVSSFKPGDQIFASTGLRLSAYAEYTCVPAAGTVALKPANMTYAEAAAVPVGGLEAFQLLRLGNIRRGQRVLVIGAGGSIGTFGVQLAKYWGAEVTGLDSTDKLDMLRSIGAERVIDFTREDFTKNGQSYDLIFDAPGKSSYSRCRGSLRPEGLFLSANPGCAPQLRTVAGRTGRRGSPASGQSGGANEALRQLRQLIEAGGITTVIDRRYPLEQTAEAHRYAETGRKKGNIIITLQEDPSPGR